MMRACFVAMCCGILLQQAQPPRDTRRAVPAAAASAAIEGTVVSDEAQPKRLRRTRVTLNGSGLQVGHTVVTDDEGRFRFAGLALGRYAVEAAKDAYVGMTYGSARPTRPRRMGEKPNVTPIALASGETRTIVMRLPRGAVISGVVVDPDGQPVAGIPIAAFADRFLPATGERRLTSAGMVATDDRGTYRLFGLPAGAYVVFAQPSIGSGDTEMKRTSTDSKSMVAAPVYFPSATDADRAIRITVGAGEERDGVDVQLQYVPTVTVRGYVSAAMPLRFAAATLIRLNDPRASVVFAGSALVSPDGQFSLTGVAPGRYTISVRGQSAGPPDDSSSSVALWGSTEVYVDGEDIANASVELKPGFSISGRLVFEGAVLPVPLGQMSLPVVPVSGYAIPSPHFQPSGDGRFTIGGVAQGVYRVMNPNAGIRSPIGKWWLRSIVIDGREVLDGPLEIRQSSDNAVITLSDEASEVAGAVTDVQGQPLPGTFAVIFSADHASWFFNSRRVAGVLTDPQGRYSIRNLPPGEYRARAVTDIEQGEWYDPVLLDRLLASAVPVSITGVERKSLDLIVR